MTAAGRPLPAGTAKAAWTDACRRRSAAEDVLRSLPGVVLALALGLALPAGMPSCAVAAAPARQVQDGQAGGRAIQDALQVASRQSAQAHGARAGRGAEDAGAPGGKASSAGASLPAGEEAQQASPGRRAGYAAPSPSSPSSRSSASGRTSLDRLLRLSPDARAQRGARPSLRLKVVADAGTTLAFQQGFQSRHRELMAACERRAADFDRIFDFGRLILDGRVLPPVIRWTGRSVVVDSPTSATAADATYVIERPARIVASAPGWREWLAVEAEPFEPDQALLPRTGEERRVWQEAVREGWTAGRAHADSIFEASMASLEADYRGMLRFRMLADRGFASHPVLAEGQAPLSIEGGRLSVNETTSRITVPASFEAAGRQLRAGRPGHAALLPE